MTNKVFYQTSDGIKICAIVHSALSQPARGNIILAHGITVDKREDVGNDSGLGAFEELADQLAEFNVIRFDFRGHGESGGKQEQMTIAGEYLDLLATIEYIYNKYPIKTGIVAASFGSIAAVRYTAEYPKGGIGRWFDRLQYRGAKHPAVFTLVLWNPVLDLQKTFIKPIVPWAKASFNKEGFKSLEKNGYLLLDSVFRIGKELVSEMRVVRPYMYMKKIRCPVLTLHGDKDTYVPFAISKQYSKPNKYSEFINVKGSDHGFGKREDRNLVTQKTVEWLKKNSS